MMSSMSGSVRSESPTHTQQNKQTNLRLSLRRLSASGFDTPQLAAIQTPSPCNLFLFVKQRYPSQRKTLAQHKVLGEKLLSPKLRMALPYLLGPQENHPQQFLYLFKTCIPPSNNNTASLTECGGYHTLQSAPSDHFSSLNPFYSLCPHCADSYFVFFFSFPSLCNQPGFFHICLLKQNQHYVDNPAICLPIQTSLKMVPLLVDTRKESA